MSAPTSNFAGRDFAAWFEALLNLLTEACPELTDRNHSDAGITQLRLVASTSDMEAEYQDLIYDAGTTKYAQFKQDLIDLGRNVEYLPVLASPASTRMELTRIEGITGAINIPKYMAFGRSDGLTYLTVEDSNIAAEAQSAQVNAIQGAVVNVQIEPANITCPDFSGRPRVNIGSGVAAGSVEVTHGSDPVVTWTEVDSFWRSVAADRHFLCELCGDDDTVWLVFGDGTKGSLPPTDVNVNVRFVRTDGAAGNCGSGVISSVPDALSGMITARNIEAATGGGPAETTESIRQGIPAMVRTQRRGLTKEDYETLIGHMPGVLHVQAVDRSVSRDWPHMYAAFYVVPNGGGPMSSLLKDQIWAACAEWGHLGAYLERYILMDATEAPVNISVKIGILPGYTTETVVNAVTTAIQAVLAAANEEIGAALSFNDLFQAANAVAGVSYADFISPTSDVPRAPGEINVAGVITVTVA